MYRKSVMILAYLLSAELREIGVEGIAEAEVRLLQLEEAATVVKFVSPPA